MPEMVALDETPLADDSNGAAEGFGCPECTRSFTTSAGVKRHVTRSHNPNGSTSGTASAASKGARGEELLGQQWAQFQQGCSVLVALACSTCAAILASDAQADGKAISGFVIKRPKLRRQVEAFLQSADLLILMSVVGATAQKMMAHHSVGRKLGFGTGHSASNGHNPQEKMIEFMAAMPPDVRHRIMDQALQARQAPQASQAPQAPQAQSPGVEPTPSPTYTPDDRAMMARMAQNGAFESVDAMSE